MNHAPTRTHDALDDREPMDLSPKATRLLLALVAAAFFMQTLDSTIVNTAVPPIAQALAVTPLSLKTALTAYVLTLAVCIPASPWLADRFGTRRVFAISISVFTLGSLACGLAQDLPQLVAARVLQGMGGALLMPVGRYVLVRSFSRREFVSAMSMVAIPGLLGPVLGPVLGGFLSEYVSWRLIFLINLPVGLLGLWLNRRAMPDIRGPRRPFDFAGFILFAVASVLLMTAAENASSGYSGLRVAILAVAGIVFAAVYIAHSRRTPHPVTEIALLRRRTFAIAVGGGLFMRLATGGMSFLLVLFLQVGCGWSPFRAGLIIVPQAVGMIAMKPLIDRALTRFGYRRVLFTNTLLVSVLLACFALFDRSTPAMAIGALVFVYGFMMSLQYTSMNTLAYIDLESSRAAQASSLMSSTQYLSVSFGIALSSLLMAAFVNQQHVADSYVGAFRFTVLILSMFIFVAAFIFRRLRDDRHPDVRST
jgi:EmrB/QacA subfamily drug resistance transporter